ncbi:Uncharacterised protein [Mycobacterium tuberculosis]|nr:Uncharacterised protein [Mycobacterium tuberculosis]
MPTSAATASRRSGRPPRRTAGPAAARPAAMPSTNAADSVAAAPEPSPFTSPRKSAAQKTMQNSTPTARTRSNHRRRNAGGAVRRGPAPDGAVFAGTAAAGRPIRMRTAATARGGTANAARHPRPCASEAPMRIGESTDAALETAFATPIWTVPSPSRPPPSCAVRRAAGTSCTSPAPPSPRTSAPSPAPRRPPPTAMTPAPATSAARAAGRPKRPSRAAAQCPASPTTTSPSAKADG